MAIGPILLRGGFDLIGEDLFDGLFPALSSKMTCSARYWNG